MNKTESLTIDMNLKDAIKMDILKIDKSETYLMEEVLPEDGGFNRYLYQASKI